MPVHRDHGTRRNAVRQFQEPVRWRELPPGRSARRTHLPRAALRSSRSGLTRDLRGPGSPRPVRRTGRAPQVHRRHESSRGRRRTRRDRLPRVRPESPRRRSGKANRDHLSFLARSIARGAISIPRTSNPCSASQMEFVPVPAPISSARVGRTRPVVTNSTSSGSGSPVSQGNSPEA